VFKNVQLFWPTLYLTWQQHKQLSCVILFVSIIRSRRGMTKHTCHSQKASTLLCEMSRQTFFRGIVSLNTTDETAIEVRCTFIINISPHISCYWHHIGENCDVSLFYWDTIAGTAVTGHTGVTCGIRSSERHSKPTQMHACDVWSDSPVLWWYTKHSRTHSWKVLQVCCVWSGVHWLFCSY